MRIRRIIGMSICAVGIYLIICAIDAFHRISEARGFAQDVSDFFQHNPGWWNPLVTAFGGEAQQKIDRGDTQAIVVLIVGICLTVLGAVMALFWRGPKKQ